MRLLCMRIWQSATFEKVVCKTGRALGIYIAWTLWKLSITRSSWQKQHRLWLGTLHNINMSYHFMSYQVMPYYLIVYVISWICHIYISLPQSQSIIISILKYALQRGSHPFQTKISHALVKALQSPSIGSLKSGWIQSNPIHIHELTTQIHQHPSISIIFHKVSMNFHYFSTHPMALYRPIPILTVRWNSPRSRSASRPRKWRSARRPTMLHRNSGGDGSWVDSHGV